MTIRLRSGVSRIREFGERLARDSRGNALLMMAAGIFPVVSAIGAGVDLTRGYMAQARLQEAVDAATLAGRKAMDGTDVSTATAAVNKFIAFNYPSGIYGSQPIATTLSTTADGALIVKATGSVPTIMMNALGINTMPIAAQSSAKRAGTNIDVILVLDVTGSMAYDVNGGTSGTRKIDALKTATLNFLDQLDSTRTQLESSGLRVRVGIIPYSQTVNIGRFLSEENSSYIAATAQPAVSQLTFPVKGSGNNGTWSNKLATTSTADYYGWACYGLPNNGATCKTALNLTSFVTAGGAGGSAYSNPYAWKGCVEMRDTVTTITASSSDSTIPTGAWDITDIAPGTIVSGKAAPAWRPYFALPQWDSNGYGPPASSQVSNWLNTEPWKSMTFKVQNAKGSTYAYEANVTTLGPSNGSDIGPNSYCPAEVKLLSNEGLETKAQLTNYVNALTPVGSTLHDVGMFWGLAMISPGAPFVNADTYNSREVKRYIVFMTDGDMDPNEPTYSAYGIDDHEVRTKTGTGDTTALHNKRFTMLCQAAKAQGVNISTIAFGTSVTSQLQTCATTTDQAYLASSASQLNDIFKQIAQNIGYLRLAQ